MIIVQPPDTEDPIINAPAPSKSSTIIVQPSETEDPIINAPAPASRCPCPCPQNKDESEPRLRGSLANRLAQPYMGLLPAGQWDKNGFIGRFMHPLEEAYVHFIPNNEMVQSINVNQERVKS